MSRKPKWDERVKKAQAELDKTGVDPQKILGMVSKCLKEKGIKGEAKFIKPQSINYKGIGKDYGTNGEGHIIWIEFVKKRDVAGKDDKRKYVAVVGAGKDIGFPQKGATGTGFIFSKLLDIEWDKTQVIIIPVKDLDGESYGLKNVDNILKCRNGVEHCIGEYLIKEGVPILNYYQHKNYSEKFWNECEKDNYQLKK